MEWLSVIIIVFLLLLGALPALIHDSYQAQRRSFSASASGPRAPVWTAYVQAGLGLGTWCAATAFGLLVFIASRNRIAGDDTGETLEDVKLSRVALFVATLLSQGCIKLNAVVLYNVGGFGVLWICIVSAGAIAGIVSIVLVSIPTHSPSWKLLAVYIPTASVSVTEIGFTLVIVTKIWSLHCSASKKRSQMWPFISHSVNLIFLWLWTALLDRTSAVVIVILQCLQLLVLAVPLRFSPLAVIFRQKGTKLYPSDNPNIQTTNSTRSTELRQDHESGASNVHGSVSSSTTLYHASLQAAASV